jgi:hypothetical protein
VRGASKLIHDGRAKDDVASDIIKPVSLPVEKRTSLRVPLVVKMAAQ